MANRRVIPLLCVYKRHQVIRDPLSHEVLRVVRSGGMCLDKSPRNESDDSKPQYANRFGEPLCEEHRMMARDPHAFAD